MKKIDAYTLVLEAVKNTGVDTEALEVFEKDVARMQERETANRKETEAKAAARAEVLEEILGILRKNGKAMLCKELAEAMGGEYTPQKLSYTLKEAVANGKLKRIEEGRSIFYSAD